MGSIGVWGRGLLVSSALALAACHDFSEVNFGRTDAAVGDAAVGDTVSESPAGCPAMQIASGGRCLPEPISCQELGKECAECATCRDGSCCSYTLVEGSPDFSAGYDGTPTGAGVTGWAPLGQKRVAIADFYLDTFEVTVGRFRMFLNHYPSLPQQDAGRRSGSATGTGWKMEWGNANQVQPNSVWAKDKNTLLERVKSCTHERFPGETTAGPRIAGWIENPTPETDRNPMTCVTWFEAYMFCIWDGNARLPYELEWSYAATVAKDAAGALVYRPYPWAAPTTTDDMVKSNANVNAGRVLLQPVGSFAAASAWGQFDLAGNAFEMVRDWITSDATPPTDSTGNERQAGFGLSLRGGSFAFSAAAARSAQRLAFQVDPAAPMPTFLDFGWRCARDPVR